VRARLPAPDQHEQQEHKTQQHPTSLNLDIPGTQPGSRIKTCNLVTAVVANALILVLCSASRADRSESSFGHFELLTNKPRGVGGGHCAASDLAFLS
jgi:hypothetical protein